ncbi:hypothetical protein [Mariniblastus fucicola]|uniref:Uncharacterized protein n=1 Tax=Mariniblastus fucicola TaxID=980251 RepID=A0A5B9PGI6_9BACT|nr:hypothetical protein [Mariniblastus fucicola]QEG24370.1 hypothetical protein MFFC18_42890 [Mariniblastus fucicola]
MKNDLSDNQKRTICRLLFLLFCALPTFTTVYFATHQRTPDQWAKLLQAELGVETSIGIVETPRPGEIWFHDVKLFGNDGQPIVETFMSAKVTLGNINRVEFRNPIQVKREGLSHFLEEAAERLVKSQSDLKPWEIEFRDIEVISRRESEFEYDSFHMNRLYVTWHNGRDGRVVTIEAPLDSEESGQAEDRGVLRMAKNPDTGTFSVAFDTTNKGKVPCWLASYWFPELETKLGADAHFSGVASIDSSDRGVQCELTGSFVGIQLPNVAGVEADLRKATAIFVNGLELEDSQWTVGKAAIAFENGLYREMPNPLQYRRAVSQQTELFTEVLQATFHEGFDTTLLR